MRPPAIGIVGTFDVENFGDLLFAPTLVADAAGVPVAWNALGASPDTPAWARPLVPRHAPRRRHSARLSALLAELTGLLETPSS